MADMNEGFKFVTDEETEQSSTLNKTEQSSTLKKTEQSSTPRKTVSSNVGPIRTGARTRNPMQLSPYSVEAAHYRQQKSPNRPKKSTEVRDPIMLKLRTSKSRLDAEEKSAKPGEEEEQEIREGNVEEPKKSTMVKSRKTRVGPKKSLIVKLPIASERLRALVEERDDSIVSPASSAYSLITTHTDPPPAVTPEGQAHMNEPAPQRMYTLQEVEAVFSLMGMRRWDPTQGSAGDAMELDE